MSRKFMGRACVAGALLVLSVAGAALPSEAAPDRKKVDSDHVLDLMGTQRVITQQMSKETVLLALGVDKEAHIKQIKSSQAFLERTIKGLRDGDAGLRLPATRNKAILAEIDRVEEIWALYKAALREGLSSGKLSRASVAIIADLSQPLMKAIDAAVQGYRKEASEGNLFSMLTVAIDFGDRQRMLTQKMTKEFLLIVYGHETARNQRELRKSIDDFTNTLRWMIDGNPKVRLLPAPTPRVSAQLRQVQERWAEFRPLLETALGTGKIDPDLIGQVSRMNMILLEDMSAAVRLYEGL